MLEQGASISITLYKKSILLGFLNKWWCIF